MKALLVALVLLSFSFNAQALPGCGNIGEPACNSIVSWVGFGGDGVPSMDLGRHTYLGNWVMEIYTGTNSEGDPNFGQFGRVDFKMGTFPIGLPGHDPLEYPNPNCVPVLAITPDNYLGGYSRAMWPAGTQLLPLLDSVTKITSIMWNTTGVNLIPRAVYSINGVCLPKLYPPYPPGHYPVIQSDWIQR